MHPILLVTALLVGLPILLHLILKQEPKRLVFPAVRFLLQRRKISQRKLRLKHLLLLALRVLLIALFGLALFQPTFSSSLPIFAGETPVAAVFLLDTSPGMGYVAADRSRLAEAKRRALELLDELPPGSRVAVLDPTDPVPVWQPTVADARRRIEDLPGPHAAAVPVSTALAAAYQLLRTVDQEADSGEPMSRLVAVFSDRTAGSWDAGRNEDLVRLRDGVPPPAVAHLYIDVGIDGPANLAVTNVEIKPQVRPQGTAIPIDVGVAAAGPGAETGVVVRVVGSDQPEQRKPVTIPADGTANVSFVLDGRTLAPGIHQLEVKLDAPDKLPADNVRYATFRVAEPRRVLTVIDDPAAAALWQRAHDVMGEFTVEIVTPDRLPADLGGFAAVALLNTADPAKLWPALDAYVSAGGKLLLMPGPNPIGYAAAASEPAARLLPGSIVGQIDTANLPKKEGGPDRTPGVSWYLDDPRHPMLRQFPDWKRAGNVGIIVTPPRAWRYHEVEKTADGSVVVFYDDADEMKARHPAVLERSVGPTGRVLLLTTRMDVPPADERWNDYWQSDTGWGVVLPNILLRYLAGDPTDANFNYLAGVPVVLPLPAFDRKLGKVELQGPGVTPADSGLPVTEAQAELRVPAARTRTAGSFKVTSADGKFADGFSVNPPAEESALTRLPPESIDPVMGPEALIPAGKAVDLRKTVGERFGQPAELFPWLLILVLLLLAAEGVVANRFYRS